MLRALWRPFDSAVSAGVLLTALVLHLAILATPLHNLMSRGDEAMAHRATSRHTPLQAGADAATVEHEAHHCAIEWARVGELLVTVLAVALPVAWASQWLAGRPRQVLGSAVVRPPPRGDWQAVSRVFRVEKRHVRRRGGAIGTCTELPDNSRRRW